MFHLLAFLLIHDLSPGLYLVSRRVPLVEQGLLTLPEHMSSPPFFSGVHVARSLVFCVVFYRSLFVLLCIFFWPLCCLFFLDLRIMITPMVSSNSSCINSVNNVAVGSIFKPNSATVFKITCRVSWKREKKKKKIMLQCDISNE